MSGRSFAPDTVTTGGRGIDRAIGAAIFAATVVYLAAFPRDLGMADESYFLYEAARIRNGEVMYRDIFNFTTPLSAYAMALLFWIFGTTIDTARLSTAAVHGLATFLLFAICRRIGVRRSLAVVPALAYLAICQAVWPYASWHWWSTTLTVLLLWTMLQRHWDTAPRAAIVAGLITGCLAGVHQQKGVIVGAAMGVVFVFDHLLHHPNHAKELRALLARLLYFAGGVALVVVPTLAVHIALAGVTKVYDALVRFPFESYRPWVHVRWGRLGFLAQSFASRTYPDLLRFSPLALVPLAVRAAVALATGKDRRTAATANILVVFGLASIASILYYPDLIHIGFIAPVFLVCAAETIEWTLGLLRHRRLAGAVGWAVAGGLSLVFALRLAGNLDKAADEFPFEGETAFGRIAFAYDWEPLIIDHVTTLLDRVEGRELFCYANIPSFYLTTDAHNPTPFQFFTAAASPPSQTRDVLDTLERRKPPYILVSVFYTAPKDPVANYIRANYERVDIPTLAARPERVPIELYRRRADS